MREIEVEKRIEVIRMVRGIEGFSVEDAKSYYYFMSLDFITESSIFVYYTYSAILPILAIVYEFDFFIGFMMLDIIVD